MVPHVWAPYFVRADHIGRPVFATDAAGAKVWEATYLPFGGVHTTGGTPIQLRFPGQWYQTETGLHQNWMRDYDPTTGRYMQADPLGLIDGASVYGYARQNPGRYVDPRGESAAPHPNLPRQNTDGLLHCADSDVCRDWYEELRDLYEELIILGEEHWPSFEAYNDAAEAYNKACGGPGGGNPALPLIPLDPNRGAPRWWQMIPPAPLLDWNFEGDGGFVFPPLFDEMPVPDLVKY